MFKKLATSMLRSSSISTSEKVVVDHRRFAHSASLLSLPSRRVVSVSTQSSSFMSSITPTYRLMSSCIFAKASVLCPSSRIVTTPLPSLALFMPLRGVKTKKAAAKRFIKTGSGNLKYGHAGKRHLTSHKSKDRKRRLNKLGILDGVWKKKMMKIL